MDFYNLKQWHSHHKETSLHGRYIRPDDINPLLIKYQEFYEIKNIGFSVERRIIHAVKIGTGTVRILAWSQMHGNEATTTKAVFDLLKYFCDGSVEKDAILKSFTLLIIPMLNPDGAERYTRLNANDVDLNRDAQQLSQPESRVLKEVYTQFKPDYCLNLHGQRTIFGVGNPPKSATIALLSPAQDKERSISASRLKGMALINEIHDMLETFIPGAIGRYDDAYNINCVGDTLQSLDIPTILFEAGHYQDDYLREQTRQFIFLSLLKVLNSVRTINVDQTENTAARYFDIPENKECFFDIILRNLQISDQTITDIAIQYEESLVKKELKFIPKVKIVGDLTGYHGHKEYNLDGNKILQNSDNQIVEGSVLRRIQLQSRDSITFSVN